MTDSFWLNRADFQPVAKVGSLSEMVEALKRAPKQVVSHHITSRKNDFANWVREALHNPDLAAKVSAIKHDDPKALEKLISLLSFSSTAPAPSVPQTPHHNHPSHGKRR